MINLKDILDGFLALIRFFTERVIALTTTWLVFDWSLDGRLSALLALPRRSVDDLALWVAEASSLDLLIGEANRQNLLFALFLVALMGGVYYADAAMKRLGSMVPVTMVYQPGTVFDEAIPSVLNAWRYYTSKFDVSDFKNLVSELADERVVRGRHWWQEAFSLFRSWLAIALLLVLAPLLGLYVLEQRIAIVILGCCAGLATCAFIEGKAYRNDLDIGLRKALNELIKTSVGKPAPRSQIDAMIQEWAKDRAARGHQSVVMVDLNVPYFGGARFAAERAWSKWKRADADRKKRRDQLT